MNSQIPHSPKDKFVAADFFILAIGIIGGIVFIAISIINIGNTKEGFNEVTCAIIFVLGFLWLALPIVAMFNKWRRLRKIRRQQ